MECEINTKLLDINSGKSGLDIIERNFMKNGTRAKRNPKLRKINQSEKAFLDAAEVVFGEKGYSGTSMRAVAQKAKANLGAISYYFGSKEMLVKKVLERSLKPANEERLQKLRAYREASQSQAPDFMLLLRGYIEPFFTIHKVKPIFDKMVLRIIHDPAPQVQRLFGEYFDEPSALFIELARKCNPELSDQEAYWRLTSISGVMSQVLVSREEVDRVTQGKLTFQDEDQGFELVLRSLYNLYMAPPDNLDKVPE